MLGKRLLQFWALLAAMTGGYIGLVGQSGFAAANQNICELVNSFELFQLEKCNVQVWIAYAWLFLLAVAASYLAFLVAVWAVRRRTKLADGSTSDPDQTTATESTARPDEPTLTASLANAARSAIGKLSNIPLSPVTIIVGYFYLLILLAVATYHVMPLFFPTKPSAPVHAPIQAPAPPTVLSPAPTPQTPPTPTAQTPAREFIEFDLAAAVQSMQGLNGIEATALKQRFYKGKWVKVHGVVRSVQPLSGEFAVRVDTPPNKFGDVALYFDRSMESRLATLRPGSSTISATCRIYNFDFYGASLDSCELD